MFVKIFCTCRWAWGICWIFVLCTAQAKDDVTVINCQALVNFQGNNQNSRITLENFKFSIHKSTSDQSRFWIDGDTQIQFSMVSPAPQSQTSSEWVLKQTRLVGGLLQHELLKFNTLTRRIEFDSVESQTGHRLHAAGQCDLPLDAIQ